MARIGSLTADAERFMPWRTVDGTGLAPKSVPELQTLLQGACDRRRLLDLLRDFTVFGATDSGLAKIIAGYHQFHAVSRAVDCTVAATAEDLLTVPHMTRHAVARQQQRAVPSLVTSLLLDYGTSMRNGGVDVVYLDKHGRRRLREAIGGGRNLALIERWLNTYAVLGADGAVVTVARRRRRLRRP